MGKGRSGESEEISTNIDADVEIKAVQPVVTLTPRVLIGGKRSEKANETVVVRRIARSGVDRDGRRSRPLEGIIGQHEGNGSVCEYRKEGRRRTLDSL